MNLRPSGYEPDELPGCSIPRQRSVFSSKRDTVWLLIRCGNDLLSHALRRSTISAAALNCRVRDGVGCFARAMITTPKKKPTSECCPPLMRGEDNVVQVKHAYGVVCVCIFVLAKVSLTFTGSNQAYRAISTSQLNTLRRLHLWPIDEVVYLGSQGYLVLKGASRLDAFSGYPVRS